VFGHTPVRTCRRPTTPRAPPVARGPLIGIDTGAGKGGPLTCLELPSRAVLQVFPDGQLTRGAV
jgi:hypothetical protein